MSDIEKAKPKRGKGSRQNRRLSADQGVPTETATATPLVPASEIEWNESTSSLDFKEQNELPETSEQEDTLARFEELARRVAETVSKKRVNEDVIEAADVSTVEVTEGTDELGGVEVAAAEVAETELTETEIPEAELALAPKDVAAGEPSDATSEISLSSDDAVELLAEDESMVAKDALASLATDESPIEPATASELAGAMIEMEQMNIGALSEELSQAENDADPEPVEFVEHDRLMSIIESLLFSTDKPVSTATIKQVFKGSNVRSKDIARAIDLLASEYASAQRGVTLEEINGGFQLRTKADNTEYLRRLAKVRPFRLSGPALEVMAIVAYKQPCTKHEIDEIRGVESGHLLRALMERGLVSFGDKSDLPGKPMTYQSTRKFLETFGLRNIRELPSLGEIDELLPEGIGEVEEEKETLSDLTDQMSTTIGSTYSEGEDELTKINEQLNAVDTTSEFFEQEKVRERDRRDRERAQDIREKIVLGDAVEEKDRRWLDRYEAKLHAPPPTDAIEAAAADAVGEPGAEPVAEGIGSALEALTDESKQDSLSATDDELAAEEALNAELGQAEESDDELSGKLDWDDDSEKEV